ncbi:MAG: FAD-binding oxidoreductase, partial [Sutterellaceae bacterium]|nr:FAD-binding oxidoreductase [Sutterellaceae bacterium]
NEQANVEGGWSGWRPFVVDKKVEESADATSFYLKPADGGKVPSYKAGQFVSVRAYIPGANAMQPRQYTLSCASLCPCGLRITVKRIDGCCNKPAGLMSNHLHSAVKAGDVIELSAPAGEFYLAEGTNPVVLVAGGIGVTPIFAMLQEIAEKTPSRPVTVVQVARDTAHLALGKEVREALSKCTAGKGVVFLTQPTEADKACGCPAVKTTGRPTADDIKALAPAADADVYICGPVSFMADMSATFVAAGVAADKVHTEAFGTGNQS